jgi:predicted DNA-binding transcriptional regulator AlpA
MTPTLLRERDAADYLGLSRMSLRRHGPPPIKIGRLARWPVAALDAWLASRINAAHRASADQATEQAIDAIRKARKAAAR